MKDFIKVMKALSDQNRVKIVKMLQHKMMCVCEIQEALRIAQSSVSKHLKILEEAGLVDYKKDGLWVNYEPELKELIKRLPHICREEICKR